MHEWMNRKATNETMKQSINEWGNQWMKPWKMIQSINQRVSESMNESMSGLMKWKRNEHEITWNEMNPMSEWENEWASEIQYSTSSIILLALQNICIIMYNIYIYISRLSMFAIHIKASIFHGLTTIFPRLYPQVRCLNNLSSMFEA